MTTFTFMYKHFEVLLNLVTCKEGDNDLKRAKPGDYDMDGIRATKIYEQNPEAQFCNKEKLTLISSIIRNNRAECVYAHYLSKIMIDGYTVRELAKLENESIETIQERVNHVTEFLKRKAKELK